MVQSVRLFNCARCTKQVTICRRCDRGNRFCSRQCSQAARDEAQREAGKRYQGTRRGRQAHALRQSEYRQRQREAEKVTHQGSEPPIHDALLDLRRRVTPKRSRPAAEKDSSPYRCAFCGQHGSDFMRLGFLQPATAAPP